MELDANFRRPPDAKAAPNMINAMNYQNIQPVPLRLQAQRQSQFNSPREVSETDLYLLGAIEKLVYRVDYMEKRLKRTEQLVYYLMQGNNQKLEAEPCPKDFLKIGTNCYHFGSKERVDWKTAASKCKALGSGLAELDKIEKYQDVVAHVLSSQGHRGHDFWIGGLNPGDPICAFTDASFLYFLFCRSFMDMVNIGPTCQSQRQFNIIYQQIGIDQQSPRESFESVGEQKRDDIVFRVSRHFG